MQTINYGRCGISNFSHVNSYKPTFFLNKQGITISKIRDIIAVQSKIDNYY